jgi:hypothetical protein
VAPALLLPGVGASSCSRVPEQIPSPAAEVVVATSASAASTALAAPPSAEEPDALPSPQDKARLQEYLIRAKSSPVPDASRSPEVFARSMKGTMSCNKRACQAGKEVCVASPDGSPARCKPIDGWIDHRTPRPRDGFPPLSGITACAGSHNCPAGSVCCLHEIGQADVQAIVCHADLSECRDHEEYCTAGATGDCRTPGTRCTGFKCEPW